MFENVVLPQLTVENIQAFHFLRPLWFFALIPLIALVWLLWQRNRQSRAWQAFITPHLMRYLLAGPQLAKRKVSLLPLALFLAGLLAIISLAGPSWRELPQPVEQKVDLMVIVLDLSLSMNATDLSPSRIARTRFKIQDLLAQRKEGLTGLVAYSGDAHIVVPLTEDSATINAMLPSLNPLIMPIQGNRPETGVAKALDLLAHQNVTQMAPGHIVLFSDDLTRTHGKKIDRLLRDTSNRLTVVAVGTTQGAPIPKLEGNFLRDKNNHLVIPKVRFENFTQFSQETGASFLRMQPDDRDIRTILSEELLNLGAQTTTLNDKRFDIWCDEGIWLVWVLLPFAALLFRRGYLISLLLMVTYLGQPTQVSASDWAAGLWHNDDQRGKIALDQGKPEQAMDLFESDQWRAVASYRAGQFEQAGEDFALDDSAKGHFNRGNALAHQHDFMAALAAYEAALQKDKNLTAAAHNKAIIEKILEQQNEGQSQSSSQNASQDASAEEQQTGQEPGFANQSNTPGAQGQRQQSNNQSDHEQDLTSQQPQQDDSGTEQAQQKNTQLGEQDSEKEPAEHGQANGDEQDDEQDNEHKKALTSQMTSDEQLNEEKRQALEVWLQRVPDDPGGLLRRKFLLESRRNPPKSSQGEKTW